MSQKPVLLFFKSHVDTFTRKDGVVVQSHETKVQAKANLADVVKTHNRKFESKAEAWGNHGSKVPASDIPADAPSFTHKEVYGHDGKTSPAGDDFSEEFKKKAPQHFVINHKNGDRHLVNTDGYGYARYHATIDKPKQETAPESPTKQFTTGDGRNIKNAVFDHDKKLMRGFDNKDHAKEFADGLNHVHAAGKADHMKQAVSAAADKHLGSISGADLHAHGASDSFGDVGRVGFGHAMTAAYKAGNGGNVDDISAHNHALAISKKHGMFDSFKAKNSDNEDFKETNHDSVRHALQHAYALGSTHASAQKDHDAGVFKKPKAHEKLHKEAEAGVAHSPEHAADHKRLMGLYDGSKATWERSAVNSAINKNHQRALKDAPAKISTKNEGNGFHGAAMNSHRAEKFGVDGDAKSEADHAEQKAAANHAFSRVAGKLVSDGHFANHEEAGNYLDSKSGRYLGDEIGHKGDPSSAKWLSKDVASYKKGLKSTPS